VVFGPLGVLAGMVAVAKGMCGGDVPASRVALWRRWSVSTWVLGWSRRSKSLTSTQARDKNLSSGRTSYLQAGNGQVRHELEYWHPSVASRTPIPAKPHSSSSFKLPSGPESPVLFLPLVVPDRQGNQDDDQDDQCRHDDYSREPIL